MTFLHSSVQTSKFKLDKKLSLLKDGIITMTQFINLIDSSDDYILFGPAIIDKTKVEDFILDWKTHQINLNEKTSKLVKTVQLNDIIDNLKNIEKIYPEIKDIVDDYYIKYDKALCKKCFKEVHAQDIADKIKTINDPRDCGDLTDLITGMILKYTYPFNKDTIDFEDTEIEWITPESISNISSNIIDKLDSCFECVIKHIGRAKILYEEAIQGYPDNIEIVFSEMMKGERPLEEYYLKYLDSCAQLDMGSAELIGDITKLNKKYAGEILDLANTIRKARLLFQENIVNVPNFDNIRLDVKRLEIKLQKDISNK